MPEGGTELAAFYIRLGLLKDKLDKGITEAKTQINDLERKTDEATQTNQRFNDSTSKSQLGLIMLGTSALAAGQALNTGATVLTRLNLVSNDTANILRVAATGIDSVTAAAVGWTQIKQFASILSGELVRGLQAVAVAAATTTGALTLLASATVIGAVIVGALLLYQEFQKAASGARELEREIGRLSDRLEDLKYIQEANNIKFEQARSDTKQYEDSLRDLDDQIKDVIRSQEKRLDIEDQLRHVSLERGDLEIEKQELKRDRAEAAASGDPVAMKRIRQREKWIEEQERDLNTRETGLKTQQAAIPSDAELQALQAQKAPLEQALTDAQKREDIAASNKKAADDEAKAKELETQILTKGTKEGKSLTNEQIIAGKGTYQEKVYAGLPRTVLKEPDILSVFATGTAMVGPQGVGMSTAAQYAAIGGLSSRTETAPWFRNVSLSVVTGDINVKSPEDTGPAVMSVVTSSDKFREWLARGGYSL